MRKWTTVFSLWLTLCGGLQAQSEFPVSDVIWEESTFTIAGQFIRYRLLCGDTTISDRQYVKIYELIYPFDGESLPTDTVPPAIYAGGLRADGAEVYYVRPQETEDLLLYDFSLEAETSVELPNTTLGNEGTYNVTDVDTVMINGQARRRLFLENVFGQTNDVWIEGIGSVVYGLLDRGLGLVFDYGSTLQCVQLTDQGFIFRPDPNRECQAVVSGCDVLSPAIDREVFTGRIRVFPNPGPGLVHIDLPADGQPWTVELWTHEGRYLEGSTGAQGRYDWSRYPPGIYWLVFLKEGRWMHSEKLLIAR